MLSRAGRQNMQVDLKGLHKVKRKLVDGSVQTYFYAWRGGPPMTAPVGSSAFISEFQRLTADRTTPSHHTDTLQEIITAYQKAPAFLDLADKTRKDYVRCIRAIESEFGDLPLAALPDPRTRGVMLDWRDSMTARRSADYHMTVLALILAWGVDRGRIAKNPLEKPGRLWRGTRADSVWTDAELDALRAVASAAVWLPVLIARDTGQREGDILRLTWSAYDGTVLRLRQGKTGRRVRIPVTQDLKAVLDATKREAVTICTTTRETAWTESGFRASFRKACEKAKITGRTFHDLRGTAITRLALAACSPAEIATITGHSLKSVEAVIDRHYLSRVSGLGDGAITKLEKHRSETDAVKRGVKRSGGASDDGA